MPGANSLGYSALRTTALTATATLAVLASIGLQSGNALASTSASPPPSPSASAAPSAGTAATSSSAPAGPAASSTAANHVIDVRMHGDDATAGGAQIEIVGTRAPVYNARVADGGRRLLVDLSDSDVTGAPAAITSAVGVVGGVLTQAYATDGGSMARVTVALQHEASYRLVPDGTTLRVLVAPRAGGASPAAPGDGAQSAAKVAVGTNAVSDVRFERVSPRVSGCAPNGCDRVLVDLERIPPYSLATGATGRLRMELRATGLPPKLARTLDVSAYRGVLRSITAAYEPATGATVLELERSNDVLGTLSTEGASLVWSFPVPSANLPAPPVAQIHLGGGTVGNNEPGAVRHVVTVAREQAPLAVPRIETSIHDEDPVVEAVGGGAAGFTTAGENVLAQQRYSGRRIDIDLKDADIHNVLRLLADTGHVNIVTADDVGGTITIRMHNVPWDQVLDVVLQAKGLGMVRQGNLIRVAPLAQLQKERELRIAAQKQEFELTPLETRLVPVSYARADELQPRARELLSPRGSLAVDERTNVLIARDIPSNLNYIEELIRSLDTPTAEVLVEARIVEGTSSYTRDVGIQWGGDVTFTPATGNATGISFPNSITAAGGASDNNTPTAGLSPFATTVANPNFAVNLPAAVGTGAGGALGLAFGSIDNTLNLALRLSAAESSGLVRIVSAPRVLVLDNREARINQGTLIPYSQVSALGVQTTFQEAKLQLLVKPHVTADGSVAMHVKVTNDVPDFNQTAANGAPTILKREAETDLLIMDGHTAVIGGIYTRNTGRNLNQVPFFGDIPIIGILFQHRQANDSRDELVVFITPHIVNRAEALGR
ncbi:MAG TPA: type IV pilus secretin PilQ [Polyangiaceae bacterium]|nr:type IV pilus secretin PilQ [Polyangiaceae bacterium]